MSVFLHMNHHVVNIQIGLILSRLPFFFGVGSLLPVNLPHVWNTSIQLKSPEHEKVIFGHRCNLIMSKYDVNLK